MIGTEKPVKRFNFGQYFCTNIILCYTDVFSIYDIIMVRPIIIYKKCKRYYKLLNL